MAAIGRARGVAVGGLVVGLLVLVLVVVLVAGKSLKEALEGLGGSAANVAGAAEKTTQAVENVAGAAQTVTTFVDPANFSGPGTVAQDQVDVAGRDVAGLPTLAIMPVKTRDVTNFLVRVQEYTCYVVDSYSGVRVPRADIWGKPGKLGSFVSGIPESGGVVGQSDESGVFVLRVQFPPWATLGGTDAVQVWATKSGYNDSTTKRLN